MSTISLNVEGIYRLLNDLDVNKAPGPDKIPNRILKYCATEIAQILQVIFNQSLTSGNLPDDWLTANIMPIFKKGNRSSPLNYRPISLTAVCCKILEHIIYHHIMEHLSQYQIIHNYQHGFRQGYSAESQLITVTEDILYAMDHKLQTDFILLDFQKAFDTVPHQRLLSKLSSYGIQNETYSWINSWLTRRKQRVIVNGSASAWTPVKSGVPQGTVLGPLMFLIYINDIGDRVSSNLWLFADDCILYRTVTSLEDSKQLQCDLDSISEWSRLWQMNFNIRKCTVLQCYRMSSPILANYSLAGQILECVKEHSYLGIILDQQMTFTSHINYIVSKAAKVLNFLKRNLHKCSTSTKATAYVSLVRPILEYASSVWDPYQYNKIYIIDRIQRRAARWSLCNYDRYSSVTLMQHQLSWQNLQQHRKIARLLLLYKALYDHIALQIPPYYTLSYSNTRANHQFSFIHPSTRTNFYMYSFYPKTIKQWNSLSSDMASAQSPAEFHKLITNKLTCN